MDRFPRLSLAASLLVIAAAPLAAQTRILTGRIVDSITSQPVASGQVAVLGTPLTAPVHEDGSFAVSVPMREVTLQVTAESYRTNELKVAPDREEVTVAMARDYFRLDQVVVSGQATSTERRNLANSIATVTGEELTKAPASNMEQALKGKVTGADIQSSSRGPGGSMLLRLRGLTSILGNQQPLFVVDGVIVYGGIDALNPNDIEDIQILKGASASAMYGSKASAGVVIVKTKRGGLQR